MRVELMQLACQKSTSKCQRAPASWALRHGEIDLRHLAVERYEPCGTHDGDSKSAASLRASRRRRSSSGVVIAVVTRAMITHMVKRLVDTTPMSRPMLS